MERKEEGQAHELNTCPLRITRFWVCALSSAKRSGRAPGMSRSIAFHRRPRRWFACRPRTLTRERILRQRLDNAPLDGARILCFINEDVVDPLVQLVVNPCANAFTCQKLSCAGNQIFEIKQALRRRLSSS